MAESINIKHHTVWQVLDVRAIWVKEFTSALGTIVPTIGWLPRISNTGIFERWEHEEVLDDPTIRIRRFPLQRGFARIPIKWLAREGSRVTSRLASMLSEGESSTLICCSPHYAAVACRWSGPVVYYVTDLFVAWGENPNRIRTLERRLCAAADLVCPDSQRIADYLVADANCNRGKIVVLPMATRAANLLSGPVLKPAALPEDIADLPRPIAGVLGNLANNIDWVLLQEAIRQTPWLSWALIGPTAMGVLDLEQERARAALMAQLGRVRFTGYKPYGTLRDYARAFDVAVLPYRKIEPTYSGSSTRFYEHLATCRPMLATRGFEELLHKEPLLRLANSTEEMVKELELLAGADFHDGFEEVRWKASQKETWEERALAMKEAIATRLHAT